MFCDVMLYDTLLCYVLWRKCKRARLCECMQGGSQAVRQSGRQVGRQVDSYVCLRALGPGVVKVGLFVGNLHEAHRCLFYVAPDLKPRDLDPRPDPET